MSKTILVLMDDLFLLPRLQDAVRDFGYALEVITRPDDLGIELESAPRAIPLTEPLEGGEAILVRALSAMQPGLIVIDATLERIPWLQWIQVLKTSAATRRIPILVFGPHIQKDLLAQAREMGADQVVVRGTFHKRMAAILSKLTRPELSPMLDESCAGDLSPKAMLGIDLHNQGDFFEAHEALEEAWMEAPEGEGYLYRSLLQLSVAYLHLQRGNLRGARKMMLRIHQWLDPLPDVCRHVDVAALKISVDELRNRVNHVTDSTILQDLHPAQILLVS